MLHGNIIRLQLDGMYNLKHLSHRIQGTDPINDIAGEQHRRAGAAEALPDGGSAEGSSVGPSWLELIGRIATARNPHCVQSCEHRMGISVLSVVG